jgi:hypothetical protein
MSQDVKQKQKDSGGGLSNQYTISITGINGQQSYNSGIDNKMSNGGGGTQLQYETEKVLNKDLP